jgi:hypothetical protein
MKYLIVSLYCCLILLTAQPIKAQETPKSDTTSTNVDNKKQLIKVTPLAFLLGYSAIAYERSLRTGRSLEFKLGLIGLGFPSRVPTVGQAGASATIGYKFIKQPTEPPKRNRYQHILRGWYFRQDATIALYREGYTNRIYEPNQAFVASQKEYLTTFYAAIVPTVGFQRVRKQGIVSDVFAGMGAAVVYPISGNQGVVDFARYGTLTPLSKARSGKMSVLPTFKLGFLLGNVF